MTLPGRQFVAMGIVSALSLFAYAASGWIEFDPNIPVDDVVDVDVDGGCDGFVGVVISPVNKTSPQI